MLNQCFLLVHHQHHHIPEGDDADKLLSIEHQEVPTPLLFHQIQALRLLLIVKGAPAT